MFLTKLRRRSVLASLAGCVIVLLALILGISLARPGVSRADSSQDPNFKGIYEFSGNNSSMDANNPALTGRSLVYYWSQLEPQQGQYNWSLVDQDMQPWVANGKKVILRVATAGWAAWDWPNRSAPSISGNGTPQWVYDQYPPSSPQHVSSVTENDKAVLPQYWNPTFLQDYATFIQAFASHYDGNPNVTAVEMGIGDGGETKVDSYKNAHMLQLWQTIGYTDQAWWGAVQQIITSYSTAFHQTPLVVMPDKTFIGNTSGFSENMVLNYAATHNNLWLQDNGLTSSSTFSSSSASIWNQVPHIEEQRNATAQSGDTLQGDIQNALQLGGNYVLVFSSDVEASGNQLNQFAALANPSNSSPNSTGTSTTVPSATSTSTSTNTPSSTPTVPVSGTPITTGTSTTTSTGTPTAAGTPTTGSGMLTPTVGNGQDPATQRHDCHTDIIAQGATAPDPTLPSSYPVGSPWTLNLGNGTLTGQLYYCQQENSVFGIFWFIPGTPGATATGSCSLMAHYGTISTQRNIPTIYNKTSPFVYGTCSSKNKKPFTISLDNSGNMQQQTMLGETYSGDTWSLCWTTQSQTTYCSQPIATSSFIKA